MWMNLLFLQILDFLLLRSNPGNHPEMTWLKKTWAIFELFLGLNRETDYVFWFFPVGQLILCC